MEIWIEFNQGKWRISPDPAKIPRGARLRWRFRGDDLDVRHVRWTITFAKGHPFAFGGGRDVVSAERLAIATETFPPDGQHVGSSPIVSADVPGDYKYSVRLEDLDENRELGEEDPFLIVF